MPKRSRRSPQSAFVGAKTRDGRVMVVQDRRTGKWMLPGGRMSKRDRSSGRRCASREAFEESGMRLSPFALTRVGDSRDSCRLYKTRVSLPKTRGNRVRNFQRRSHKNETRDYGFVDPSNAKMVVETWGGKRKDYNPVSFRPGTVSHLRRLR